MKKLMKMKGKTGAIFFVILSLLFSTAVYAVDSGDPKNTVTSNSGGERPGDIIHPSYIEGELVVKLDTPDMSILDGINSLFGTTTKDFYPQLSVALIQSDKTDEALWYQVWDIMHYPGVITAHPNYDVVPLQSVQGSFALPDEADHTLYTSQEAAVSLDLASTHQITTGADVKVAVIDGGVNYNHPAFDGKVISGYDYVDDDNDADDELGGINSGHGTFVAGVVHLMAPDATIYSYRVVDVDGNANGYKVAEAIMQAVIDGCNVINLSMITSDKHEAISTAIDFAAAMEAVVISAAGNGSNDRIIYPAGDPDVVAVGALDENMHPADFSNKDAYINIWAPGTNIYSPYLGEDYTWWSGTSFSTPFVTGQAALIYSKYGSDSPSRSWVIQAILSTANSFSEVDGETDAGSDKNPSGIINPLASLSLEQPLVITLIDFFNRGQVIEVQKDVTGSWTQSLLLGIDEWGGSYNWSVEINNSASFITSVATEDIIPSYALLTMNPTGLDVGYYQDTVSFYVEGAINSPAKMIYTVHVSYDTLPIYTKISCTDTVWNIYQGQTYPYYGAFSVQAYQIGQGQVFPVEAPYTLWQDANPEFILLDSYPGSNPPVADGVTPDGYAFDINVANSLPAGVYYDTVYALVEGSVDGVVTKAFELHITEGDSLWIDVVGDLPDGAYAENDIVNQHYHIYFGDIEINSTRVDTLYLGVNFTGASTPYGLDIYLKEYITDTSAYDFITIPRSGMTNDTIQVIIDWSGHTHTSVGNYLRWYKVDVPGAVNGFQVLNFNFSVIENAPALIPENSEVISDINNAPNPFNPSTNISFSLAKPTMVNISVFNILGQNIKTLVDEQLSAGNHSVIWNGDNSSGAKVASGIYFYRISAGTYDKTKKMILMK